MLLQISPRLPFGFVLPSTPQSAAAAAGDRRKRGVRCVPFPEQKLWLVGSNGDSPAHGRKDTFARLPHSFGQCGARETRWGLLWRRAGDRWAAIGAGWGLSSFPLPGPQERRRLRRCEGSPSCSRLVAAETRLASLTNGMGAHNCCQGLKGDPPPRATGTRQLDWRIPCRATRD
jgi:hypothetical protein